MVEFLIGKRERMSWIEETSWGSGGTMADGYIVGLDCTVDPNWSQGFQSYLTAGADNLNIQGRVKGPLSLPYTMSFIPTDWRWLKYLMSCADADDAGTKTHTFTQSDTITSWNLEWAKRHTTDHVLTVSGNACKSATLSFQKATGEGKEGHVKVSMDCVGKSVSQGSSVTTITDGNIDDNPFEFRHVKVTIDGDEYKEVNNGEMTISLGWEEVDSRYCNTTYDNELGEPIPKVFRISGRFNINIKDKTLYDLWAAGTAVSGACTFLLDRDGSGNDQILFTFTNLYILGATAGTSLEGVTNVDVVWSADSFSSVVARDSITTY